MRRLYETNEQLDVASYRHARVARRMTYEHVVVAEAALGRRLPAGAEVHHVNENKADNRPSNLVICEDHAYHALLHVRARVLRAGGNPNTQRICTRGNHLSLVGDLVVGHGRGSICRQCAREQVAESRRRHPETKRAYQREWLRRKKALAS